MQSVLHIIFNDFESKVLVKIIRVRKLIGQTAY